MSCWKKRDYSATSATGCSDGTRSCILTDPLDYTKGTTSVSSTGPSTTTTLSVGLGTATISSASGIFFEDYYYDTSCGAAGGEYLNQYNGHSHDEYGFHYHMTVDSSGAPVFPYYVGPQFYGCLSGSGQSCYTTAYGTATSTSTCGTSDGYTTATCSTSAATSVLSGHLRH